MPHGSFIISKLLSLSMYYELKAINIKVTQVYFPVSVFSSSSNSFGNSPAVMAVKRSPSMNDSHYSTARLPGASNEKCVNGMTSSNIASRIAADKAAFFSEKQPSQQIYENLGQGRLSLYTNATSHLR